MPAKRKSSKKAKKASSRSTAVVPGFTRSIGVYPGYGMRPGQELKWFDQGSNGQQSVVPNIVGGFIIGMTSGLSQGPGASQRIGRSITVRHIEVKINLAGYWDYPINTVFDPTAISYRVDLMMDRQTNGIQAAGADVYDLTLAGVDVTNKFDNLFNQDRFVRLKRWEGDINPPSFQAIAAAGGNTQLKMYRDLKFTKKCMAKVDYSGATGAIAEIRSNSLFLIFTAATNPGQLCFMNTADTRILFQDS